MFYVIDAQVGCTIIETTHGEICIPALKKPSRYKRVQSFVEYNFLFSTALHFKLESVHFLKRRMYVHFFLKKCPL